MLDGVCELTILEVEAGRGTGCNRLWGSTHPRVVVVVRVCHTAITSDSSRILVDHLDSNFLVPTIIASRCCAEVSMPTSSQAGPRGAPRSPSLESH